MGDGGRSRRQFEREGEVLWNVMYCGGEDKQWSCGKGGNVNFQKVSSIVRDIGDPCLSQSPVKVVITVRLSNPEHSGLTCSLG